MNEEARALLAHELRNPLAVIVGYAELLKLRDDDQTRREAADAILQAADRLSRLLDELAERLTP